MSDREIREALREAQQTNDREDWSRLWELEVRAGQCPHQWWTALKVADPVSPEDPEGGKANIHLYLLEFLFECRSCERRVRIRFDPLKWGIPLGSRVASTTMTDEVGDLCLLLNFEGANPIRLVYDMRADALRP